MTMDGELQLEARQGAWQRLTRKRVAERLGVSVSTVRRLEGHALHPVRGEDGVHRFDLAEVERLAPKRVRRTPLNEGQLAAAVFRMFDDGRNLRQVVTELEVSPAKVRALFAEWSNPDLRVGERVRRERMRAEEDRRETRDFQAHMRELDRLTRALQPTGDPGGT